MTVGKKESLKARKYVDCESDFGLSNSTRLDKKTNGPLNGKLYALDITRSERFQHFTDPDPITSYFPRAQYRLLPSRERERANALELIRKRLELAGHPIPNFEADELSQYDSSDDDESLRNCEEPEILKDAMLLEKVTYRYAEDCQDDILENKFTRNTLEFHNKYRSQHKAPPMQLSAALCGRAQAWANFLAHTDSFFYEESPTVGMNLFFRLSNDCNYSELTAHDIVADWYSQKTNYDYDKENLQNNINCGNFTQLIWKSSKYLGVGKARSSTGKVLVVATYMPRGNVPGEYEENVLRSIQYDMEQEEKKAEEEERAAMEENRRLKKAKQPENGVESPSSDTYRAAEKKKKRWNWRKKFKFLKYLKF